MALGLTPEEYWNAQLANRRGLEQEQQAAEAVAPADAGPQMDPREALETYRNLRGQGYDDDAIERAFQRHGWPMPPTGAVAGVLPELGRGLERGAKSTIGAGLEGLGATVGSPGLVEYGQEWTKSAAAPELQGGVADYSDINKYHGGITRGAGDVIRYGAGLLGSSLPETAAIAGAGLAAATAAPAAPVIAGGLAAFGTSLLPNLGRNVQENIDKGVAPEDVMIGGDAYLRSGAAAIGQSALDSVLAGRITGLIKGGLVRSASPNMARRMLKEAAIGAPIEGTTEAAQEALQMLAADPQIASLVTPEGKQRLISSAIGGALVGGLLEGAAGIFPEEHPPAPPGAPPEPEGLYGPPEFVGPMPAPPGTPGERYGPHEAGAGTTVSPIVPPPDAGTPLGLEGLSEDRRRAQAAREGGELFPNIRQPRTAEPPPGGPKMVDLAQGTKDVGILGRALGLGAILPQDPQQAPTGVDQGAALHAATMLAAGVPPAPELNTAAHAIAAQQAALGPFGDIPGPRPGPDIGPGVRSLVMIQREDGVGFHEALRRREAERQAAAAQQVTPPAAEEEVSAAAPPPQPAAEAGVTPPSVALPAAEGAPASPLLPGQQPEPTPLPAGLEPVPPPAQGAPPAAGAAEPVVPSPAPFTPTHIDTETGQPVQLADDGKVRAVRYEDGTVREENARKNAARYQPVRSALAQRMDENAARYQPVAEAGAAPVQAIDSAEVAAAPGAPIAEPAPPSLPAGAPAAPPVGSPPPQAFGQTEPGAGEQPPPAPSPAARPEERVTFANGDVATMTPDDARPGWWVMLQHKVSGRAGSLGYFRTREEISRELKRHAQRAKTTVAEPAAPVQPKPAEPTTDIPEKETPAAAVTTEAPEKGKPEPSAPSAPSAHAQSSRREEWEAAEAKLPPGYGLRPRAEGGHLVVGLLHPDGTETSPWRDMAKADQIIAATAAAKRHAAKADVAAKPAEKPIKQPEKGEKPPIVKAEPESGAVSEQRPGGGEGIAAYQERAKALREGTAPPAPAWPEQPTLDAMWARTTGEPSIDELVPEELAAPALEAAQAALRRLAEYGYRDLSDVNSNTAPIGSPAAAIRKAWSQMGGQLSRLAKQTNALNKEFKGRLAVTPEDVEREIRETTLAVNALRELLGLPEVGVSPALPGTEPEQATPKGVAERKWRVGDRVRITKGDNEGKFATLTHAERMVFTPALPGPRGFVAMTNLPGSESWMLRGRIDGQEREEFLHEGSIERVHRAEHRKIGTQGFDQLDLDTIAPDFAKELDARDGYVEDGNRRQANQIQARLEDRLKAVADRWGQEAADEVQAEAERISEATWELPPKKGARKPEAAEEQPYRIRFTSPPGGPAEQIESFATLEGAYDRNRGELPAGYTKGTIEERQGKRWKFIGSTELKAPAPQPTPAPTHEIAPTKSPDIVDRAPGEIPPPKAQPISLLTTADYGTLAAPNRMAAAVKIAATHLTKGDGFASITDARKAVAEMYGVDSIKPGTAEAKVVDELVELAGVVAARNKVQANKAPEETFDAIARVAERMPNLGTRTSTSVLNQAYSTPLPIAYVASRFAGIGPTETEPGFTVYEPTAGQGALLIEASTRPSTWANELNPDRADALEAQGFKVTREDAARFNPARVSGPGFAAPIQNLPRDVVIANPPFGTVRGQEGHGQRWPIKWRGAELFDTGEVDHAIAWQALSQMKPDGRAVLILGAPNEKIIDRAKGYTSGAKQKFYLALYRHYNVQAHYTLSGDLYAKQGAQWPVDMIVINGQGASSLPLPAKQAPTLITTLAEVKGLLADVAATYGRPGGAPTEGAPGGGVRVGAGEAGGEAGQLAGVPALPGAAGAVAGGAEPGQRAPAGGEAVPGGPAAVGGGRPGGVPGGAPEPAEPGPPAQPGTGLAAAAAEGPEGSAGAAPGRAPGGVGGRTGALGELDALSDADMDALLDAAMETAGVPSAPPPPKNVKAAPRTPPKPPAIWQLFGHEPTKLTKPPQAPPKAPPPKKTKPPAGPKAKPEKTAAQELSTAATKAAEAIDNALTGLFKLSGGGTSTLGSGFIWNEETYRAAVPAFKAALKATVEAGEAIANFAVKVFQQAAKMPAEWIRTVLKPMLSRFMHDVKTGVIKLEDDKPPPPAATDLQVLYAPRSTGTNPVGTLIPVNMDQVSREAFEAFEQQHGPVDAYVMKKLGYDAQELKKYFSGEQVDALALAIKTIDDGTGFIIGDQTGVGKGRVNAAVMRYAIKNRLTPIFVTEKPNLYADMIRDVDDIGMKNFRPLVTNRNLSGSEAIELPDGRMLTTGADHNDILNHAWGVSRLESPDGKKYDAIFTTYNQLQQIGKANTIRNSFVENFLPNGVLILDESHNAGGSGPKEERPSKKPQGTPRSEIIRQYVGMARSAFYSSATYAKRPDSMSLYFKTDIRLAISDLQKIDKVFKKGGVPLQQIMSAMLTKAGQYLRRERSFEGVEFTPKPFPVNPKFAGNAAEGMRGIVRFEDQVIKPLIAELAGEIAGEGTAGGGDASQINSTNFTALMHNVIDQMLLCLKADATADEAIKILEAGEKPVIAVANTMGAMIEELVQDSGITPGQPLNFSFKDVMLRYLDRTRWYTEGGGYGGKPVRHYITDEMLGPDGLAAFKATQKLIRQLDFAGLAGSPIDHITNRLTKAGWRVGEITGRSHIIDYSNDDLGPIYRTRTGEEKSKGAVVRNINRFNGGTKAKPVPIQNRLDAFILNQSGATGLSLHASEKFGDQRRRRMIIAQAERNIDTFMQMLGRVHRTGQVIPPGYILAVADIPAEKRPAAVLLKKMASLNANTTASAESSLDVGDLPDFINENGDETAAAMLTDDIELWNELGRPLKFSTKASVEGFDRADAMKKVTGRIPLLPVERQEEVYAALEEAYADLIQRKKAMGENVGGAESLDLDAKTLQSTTVFEGTGDSPFSQPAHLEQVDIKRIGKPHTSEEVVAMVENGIKSQPDMRDVEDKFGAYLDKHMEEFAARPAAKVGGALVHEAKPDVDIEREERERARLQGTMTKLRLTTRDLFVGQAVRILDPESGEAVYGVVTELQHKGKAKNPAANGSWRYTFAMADPMRRLTMPVSRFLTPSTTPAKIPGGQLMVIPWAESNLIDLGDGSPSRTVWQLFDELQSGSREKRYMLTGNVFAGFNHFNGKGQIIFYTDHDGTNRQGVLMPRSFKGAEELAKQPQELKTADAVIKFVENSLLTSAHTLDQNLTLFRMDDGYALMTPRSKAKGGRYFTNRPLLDAIGKDFVSSGQQMVAKQLGEAQARAAVKVIQENFGALYAFADQTLARKIQGIAEPKLTDQTAETAPEDAQFRAAEEPPPMDPTLSQVLSPRAAKQKASLIRGATTLAQQINPRVAVQFAERIFGAGPGLSESTGRPVSNRLERTAGYFDRYTNLVKIALDQSDEQVLRTAAHEAWHSIEELLTDAELDRLDAAYPAKGKRSQEETLAYAFEDWISDKFAARNPSFAKRIFAKALKFINDLGRMLRGRGFRSVDDIFAAAEKGEIAARDVSEDVQPVREGDARFTRSEVAPEGVQFRGRPANMPAYVASPGMSTFEQLAAGANAFARGKPARQRAFLKFQQAVFDRLASVKDVELRWAVDQGRPRHLLSARESGAKLGQMAMDDSGRMAVAMNKAPLVWDARAGLARPHASVGGLTWVAESIKTPEDYADATAFVYATRARQLLAEGRERLLTDADIADGLARGTPAARQFAQRWEQFNDAMLQFAVDTGVLSADQKAAYREHFYIPFYRQYEETGELMGPNELRRGLSNPSLRIKRLEGGTSQLGDLFENIVKNTATIASAGMRNVAMQRIHGMLSDLGEAQDIPHWQTPKGDDAVSFYEDGKRRWFRPDDDLVFASLTGMRPETVNGIVRGLQKFSSIYRKGVTATPPFMLRNWIRGVVGTWIQTGRSVSATANSFTGIKAYAAGDPIVDAIRASTGFGAYSFGEAGGMSGSHLRKLTYDHKSALGRINGLWEKWEHVGEATEMADRIALAQNLLKAGFDEAEAYYQAMNVMPYSTHGSAPWVRFLTLTVPFMNARLQGLARMLDTTSSADARGRLAKRIILRGLLLTGFTAALWGLNNSDDDKKRKYDQMTPDQRLSYWPLIFGDTMILIPKPFEFGHVFATAMEAALDSASKDTGPRDAKALAWGAAHQTFGFDTYIPLPQALVPAMEVITNWDFFRQRPIENLGVKRLPPEQRTGPSVSATAEALAQIIPGGISPLQVEHLINGYFGLGGKVLTSGVDAVAGNVGFMPERPSGIFGSGIPAQFAHALGLDSLIRDADVPLWSRWVEDFYETKRLADEQYSGARAYALQGQIADARELIKSDPSLYRMRPIFNQAEAQLSKISQGMRQIRGSNLSADDKRRQLDKLVRARNQTAETIMRTFNRLEATGGRRAA